MFSRPCFSIMFAPTRQSILFPRIMTVAEFIISIEQELHEADTRTFGPDTVFRDLPNWSSMLALLIIARIDELYSVQISASEFSRLRTLAELHDHVAQHLPA